MTAKTIKTAISFPREDFFEVESARKRLHRSRSEILLEAFRSWIHQNNIEELENSYIEGYRIHPEKLADIDAFMNAGLAVWKAE